MAYIHVQTTKSGTYRYPMATIKVRTDDPLIATMMQEAKSRRLSLAQYIHWLLEQRFAKAAK